MTDAPSKAAIDAWARAHRILKKKLESDTAIAKELGISRQALWKWTAVPPTRVVKVSSLTGMPPHRLRPDLPAMFPKPAL